MSATLRFYSHAADFERISQFLISNHLPGNRDGNWLEPAWCYMHAHSMLETSSLGKIGIWEEDKTVIAVATYESTLGEAFFELAPGAEYLKPQLLDYAERHLSKINEKGKRHLRVFVNDFDTALNALVQSRGYHRLSDEDRPFSQWVVPDPFPAAQLPPGFNAQSLADENDLAKINRVLWRGFNHIGEPPAEGVEDRRRMQSAVHFRPDLNIVIAAPDGQYAAYAGTWYDAVNRLAYVEPVATDPAYRRLGLGRCAVLEGIRRCAQEGAVSAFVGSDLLFYQSIGFRVIYIAQCWEKID